LVAVVVKLVVGQAEQIQVEAEEVLDNMDMRHIMDMVVMVVLELLLSDIGINNVKVIR